MLADGQRWLADALATEVADTVAIVSGSQRTEGVPATIGRTQYEITDDLGAVRLTWTDQDFLIRPADFQFGGTPADPKRGMKIEKTRGTAVLIYEVMAPGGSQEAKLDEHGTMWRIHTKFVGRR